MPLDEIVMRVRILALVFATLTVVRAPTAAGQSGVLIGLSPGRTSSSPEAELGVETEVIDRSYGPPSSTR